MKYQEPGIILLDKQTGVSSAKALAAVKRQLNLKKAGHAGTLDPLATGLLVCLLNSATRLAAYAESGEKVYSGTMDLGISTDTDDQEGKVLARSTEIPDFKLIKNAVAEKFVGELQQVPPQVSAVKVEGTRAYKLVRQGLSPKLEEKRIFVKTFSVNQLSEVRISFSVRCSKGTYIRALARDLGEEFGCGACLSSLRREESFPFNVKDAKTLEELRTGDILDWKELFPAVPVLAFESEFARRLLNGDTDALRRFNEGKIGIEQGEEKVIYSDQRSGRALGLLVNDGRQWKFGLNCGGSTR